MFTDTLRIFWGAIFYKVSSVQRSLNAISYNISEIYIKEKQETQLEVVITTFVLINVSITVIYVSFLIWLQQRDGNSFFHFSDGMFQPRQLYCFLLFFFYREDQAITARFRVAIQPTHSILQSSSIDKGWEYSTHMYDDRC